MAQPFLGEIRMFGGNFAPAGWAFCNGAVLSILQYDTLFNLIGTTYGGDGETTFQLPNLSGRFPIHQGTSPTTGTTYTIGEFAGSEEVSVTVQQMPIHSHPATASSKSNSGTPTNSVWGKPSTQMYSAAAAQTNMAATAVGLSGGNQPHENMMPFLCVSFIIALEGVFPPRA